jgi:hypothetical protein
MKVLFLVIAFSILSTISFGQINVSAVATMEVEICLDSKQMTVKVENPSNQAVTVNSILVTLPTGITYEIGSVNALTAHSISEQNTSNLNTPTFNGAIVNASDSLKFTVNYVGNNTAVTYQDQGNIFENIISVTYNGGSIETGTSNSYNILYPFLAITGLSPSSQTIPSGGTGNRSITITNAGYGKTDRLVISDVPSNAILTLNSVNIGTIIGDSIILEFGDFASIGNGNNFFDNGESITITEEITGISCSDITLSSTIKAHWGCAGGNTSSSISYSNTTIDFQSPTLSAIATSTISSCFANEVPSQQELKISNGSNGKAENVVVSIYKSSGGGYDQTIFSRFDQSSFTYKVGINGANIPLSGTALTTDNSGIYSVLGSNPIGSFEFNLPAMMPGDVIYINWDMYSAISGTCQDEKYMGWKSKIDYDDVCGGSLNTLSTTGQSSNSQMMTVFTETPAMLSPSATEEFTFIINSFNNTLPTDLGTDGSYKVVFTLDSDLTYQSLVFRSNSDEWSPSSINITGSTVEAIYDGLEPFELAKSEIVLGATASCGTNGWKSIELDVYFLPDVACSPTIEIPMICDEIVTSYLKCPDPLCTGLRAINYTVERINFGTSDNDINGLADATNNLDFTRVKKNRAMVGDTIETKFSGYVNGSGSYAHGQSLDENNYGVNLTHLSTFVTIYDASSSTVLTVNGVNTVATTNGSARTFISNLDITYLITLNPSLSGYAYANGDSVIVTNRYEVTSSISGYVKETDWAPQVYISSVANPSSAQELACDEFFARSTLIGYFWVNQTPGNYTVKSCTKKVQQTIGLSVGDCCSNYGGGNLFPYEYRHWGILKQIKVKKPANYEEISSQLILKNTRRTNSTISTTINISPDNEVNDTLYYDIEQYFISGALNRGDDGFGGTFKLELAPNCDVPQNTYEPVEWFFNYQAEPIIGGTETGYIEAVDHDKIRYIPANLTISSTNPTQDVNQREVTWDIELNNNNSSGISNAWLNLDPPSNFQITSIQDDAGNDLPLQSDIYLVGSISSNSSEGIHITGTFSNCDVVSFPIYTGYECTGYPTSFSTFTCSYDQYTLSAIAKASNYQVRINATQVGDVCSQYVNVELTIASVNIAHMYDMEVNFIVSDTTKMKLLEDSTSFSYPQTGTYSSIANPNFNGTGYNFVINDYESSFATEGIPGVLNLTQNEYKIKVTLKLQQNFVLGDFLVVQIDGENACSENLKTVNLSFDPNSRFRKNETAGLHLDISNSWSVSWGDYDNDGYDDLFVPGYEVNEGNILYHNNTDGTFTKITSGEIVTSLGSAVAATWGDYDNDGFLDLFVAYNANGTDRLFHNNGNGTFTGIVNDPIVTSGTYTHCGAWGDYDKDGYLDLVVTDYHPTNSNSLIHNNGDGTFERVDDSPISLETSSSVGVSWADYDNDGDLDVFIANTNNQNNTLYENEGGAFTQVTVGSIVNDGGTSVGGTWGDYDNDLDLDLYVTNSSDQVPNFMYENNGNGTFTKATSGALVEDSSLSHGASWCDYDNDGDLDLMVANDQLTKNFLFANDGLGNFTKLENSMTSELNNSYGLAWSDFDRDGDYDILIANHGSIANDFFVNEKGTCNNYLSLIFTACNSNRSGIGTKVFVKTALGWQMREISSQNNGIGGQNSLHTVFGMNEETIIDSVLVVWPSGIRQTLTNLSVNQDLNFVEECGAKICGNVYYDVNQNGIKDPSEEGLANHTVNVGNESDMGFMTNEQGYYQAYIVDGTYDLSHEQITGWTLPIDPAYTVIVNASDGVDYCNNDYGLIPVCLDPDLDVNLSVGAFRRGLQNEFTIDESNKEIAQATIIVVTV